MRRKAKEERLFQSVRAVLAEKHALLVKEKSLMKGLNRVLSSMGYVAVPKDSLARPVHRRRRGRKPGRPRRRQVRVTARTRKLKRRGRPPKKK